MSDPIQDRFAALEHAEDDSDWRDVRRRAYGRRRAVTALVAAGAVLVALLVAPGIGLGGRIIGFFSGSGRPVPLAQLASNDRTSLVLMFCRRVVLVVPPGQAPERRCAEGGNAPTVTQVANNGTRAYWKIAYPDGRLCVAFGSVNIRHSPLYGDSQFGSMGCAEGAGAADLLPSPDQPITNQIAMAGDIRSREFRVLSVSGLAGEGVVDVALVDADGATVKTPVKGHMYVLSNPPDKDWIALVAHDGRGNVVYRQPLAPGAGPHIPALPRTRPGNPPPPPPPPGRLSGKPVQQASVAGATIDVYPGGAIVHFTSDDGPYAFLRDHLGGSDEVGLECLQLAFGAGRWGDLPTAISGATFGRVLRERFGATALYADPAPPYDACSIGGHYGRRWDENVGYHSAVEFPFNPLAERFFAERAVARRLAYFVRSPKMREIRAALKAGDTAPSSVEIASRFDESVVALAARDEMPSPGKVGVWSDGQQTIVAAERADDGRRMWVELDRGRIGPHDLHGLAGVF
jgi:hypothetical protein